MKRLTLIVVKAACHPGQLSLRAVDGRNDRAPHSHITQAGFQPGERVALLPVEELERVQRVAASAGDVTATSDLLASGLENAAEVLSDLAGRLPAGIEPEHVIAAARRAILDVAARRRSPQTAPS